MNFFKSISILLFAGLFILGCKDKATDLEAKNDKKEFAAANLQTVSFTIKGMTCAYGCANTIEKELNGLEGVQKAMVNFEKEYATVSYDKTILSPEKITKIVEAAADGKSYKVINMKF